MAIRPTKSSVVPTANVPPPTPTPVVQPPVPNPTPVTTVQPPPPAPTPVPVTSAPSTRPGARTPTVTPAGAPTSRPGAAARPPRPQTTPAPIRDVTRPQGVQDTWEQADTGFDAYDASTRARFGAYDRVLKGPQYQEDYMRSQYDQDPNRPLDVSQYMPQVQGRTSFDFQREQVEGDFDREMQRQLEQLDAQLAAQGITGGAAIQARNNLMEQLNLKRAGAMNQIRHGEAQFMQDAAMTEKAQWFSREERLGEQAFTTGLTMANLNQQDRALAEQGRQFDNRTDFDAWATSMNLEDSRANRIWQAIRDDANNQLSFADAQIKRDQIAGQLQLAYDELATSTGLEREQLMAEIQMHHDELDSLERRIGMEWAERRALAQLESDLQMGRWFDQAAITQRQQVYYNQGKAGQELTPDQLEQLWTQDPLAYYAYLDGQAGLDQAVFDANMDIRTTYLDASIASLADLSGSAFVNALGNIYSDFETTFGEGGVLSGDVITRGLFDERASSVTPDRIGVDRGITYVAEQDLQPVPIGIANPMGNEVLNRSIMDFNFSPLSTGDNQYTAFFPNSGPDSEVGVALPATYGEGYTPAQGSAVLFRGTGGESALYQEGGFVSSNTIDAQIPYGSPEAQAFIASGQIPVQGEYSPNQYDEATMRAALEQNLAAAQQIDPRALQTFTDPRSPATVAAAYTQMLIDGSLTSAQIPTLDTDYVQQLAQEGNQTALKGYYGIPVNIGGMPYVLSGGEGADLVAVPLGQNINNQDAWFTWTAINPRENI